MRLDLFVDELIEKVGAESAASSLLALINMLKAANPTVYISYVEWIDYIGEYYSLNIYEENDVKNVIFEPIKL